jgi:6-pyruvoyltetrahydropterin/6-carboxytetrahydropterin synthase
MDLNFQAPYSIKVYKEYFNFAASHFLIFSNGTREPLHGHNYRVRVEGETDQLNHDMVFDFLDIKPIVREICDQLDHKLLLPALNDRLIILETEKNYHLTTPDGSEFSFPKQDDLLLPIPNTSAERLAQYLTHQLIQLVWQRYSFRFKTIRLEVEETIGQSASFIFKGEREC